MNWRGPWMVAIPVMKNQIKTILVPGVPSAILIGFSAHPPAVEHVLRLRSLLFGSRAA